MSDVHQNKSCSVNFLIILLLPLFLLFTLVVAYLGLLPIHVEMHTLGIIAFIFVIFATFVRHNANYAVCQMKGSFDVMESDLKSALRENALTIMGVTKSTLVIHDFLSEYYKEIRNDNFAKIASSVFPMLGILGTFIAIAISMPDFTVKNTDALDKEISVLLSGVGTAFYASIYGIFLSLLWTYFEKMGTAKMEKKLHNLERLYNKHIWKRSELLKHQHQMTEFKDQQIVQTLKETFNIDFIKELNEQYLRSYKTIVADTTNSFTILTDHIQIAAEELRETMMMIHTREESIKALTTMQDNMEAFNKNALILQRGLKQFDHSIDHAFVKIDAEVGEIVEKLADFASVVSDQNKELLHAMKLQSEAPKRN